MQKLMVHLNRSLIRAVPLLLIIVFVIGAIGPIPARANPGWYDTNWQYRKKITINSANVSGSTNLIDFPVLISLTSDTGLGSKAQLDGDDILFTAADETTKLSHEIEKYSSNGATANLTAWVRIPSLSSITNTEIYMYYGNAGASSQQNRTAVWDSDFRMVQHLEETTGGANAITDSTANSNNGTDNNSPTLGATGKIDGATIFNGTNNFIQAADSNSLDVTGNITIEAWVKTTDITLTNQTILEKRPGTTEYNYYLRLDGGYLRFAFYNGGHINLTDTTTRLANNTWAYVVATYNHSNIRLYVNGTQVASSAQTAALLADTASLIIAKENYDNLRFFNGTIDEIRISGMARSADWVKTSYNNQSNPSIFFTLGSEQTQAIAPSVTTDNATLVEETTATLNGNITATGGENADTRGFEWDIDAGPPYSSNWTEAGSFGTGTFNHGISGLTKGKVYYYRAMAKNSAGWSYGAEKTFLTKPDGPVSLTATANSSTQIDLSWVKGDGANRTMVRRKEVSYPTSYSDGDQVYFDTGTGTSDTGLSANTTYFYRAWSEVTGSQQWSDNYASANAATNAAPAGPTAIGGKVFIVNKASVLAPWLLLGAVLSLVFIRVIRHFRKKTPSHSLHKDTS